MVDTSNMPTFCRSHCQNTDCSKHISKGMNYIGTCNFSPMKNTEECEGYLSRRQMKEKKENVTDSDTGNTEK